MKKRYLIQSIFISSLLLLASCDGIDNSVYSSESDNVSESSIISSERVVSIGTYNNLSYKVIDFQVTITGTIDNSIKDLTVPEFIEECSVTEIEFGAFKDCIDLEAISLPFIGGNIDGETNSFLGYIFGAEDYYGNQNYVPNSLTTVTITGTSSIGEYAFEDCSNLTSITIPNGVTSIGKYAFSYCYGLTSINIPESLTSIKDHAFVWCSGLTSIIVPDNVTSIGFGAFQECNDLTSMFIPFIGPNADGISNTYFSYLFGAYSIYSDASRFVPNSLTTVTITGASNIGEYAFSNCSGLTSVTIPNGVTIIGKSAFSGCTSLTKFTIPESVTSIGFGAFDSCTGLISMIIPDKVISIGNLAFSGCTSLTTINIPESVTSIGFDAFSGCTSLVKVYYTGNSASWNLIDVDSSNTQLNFETIYYYSKTEPTESGNYWHYVDGDIVIW